MFGQGPTTGSVMVAGLAGVATGLLVAALLVAGREPQPRAYEVSSIPSETPSSQPESPVTVTVNGIIPPPLTVTRTSVPPARTVTRTVTPTSSPTSTSPTTTVLPTSSARLSNPDFRH